MHAFLLPIALFITAFSLLGLFFLMIYYFYNYSGTQVSISKTFIGLYIFFFLLLIIGFALGLFAIYGKENMVWAKVAPVKSIEVSKGIQPIKVQDIKVQPIKK